MSTLLLLNLGAITVARVNSLAAVSPEEEVAVIVNVLTVPAASVLVPDRTAPLRVIPAGKVPVVRAKVTEDSKPSVAATSIFDDAAPFVMAGNSAAVSHAIEGVPPVTLRVAV
jgi:hypothetical protein